MVLLERARHGDRAALEQLFARCAPSLHRWAKTRIPLSCHESVDVIAVIQDTILDTVRRAGELDLTREGALHVHLRRSVERRLGDELRRMPRTGSGRAAAASEPSPLEAAIGRDALERYELALTRLEPTDREAIVGRVELGYSYRDLAHALGRPTPEAAKVTLERAILRLAEQMNHGA